MRKWKDTLSAPFPTRGRTARFASSAGSLPTVGVMAAKIRAQTPTKGYERFPFSIAEKFGFSCGSVSVKSAVFEGEISEDFEGIVSADFAFGFALVPALPM